MLPERARRRRRPVWVSLPRVASTTAARLAPTQLVAGVQHVLGVVDDQLMVDRVVGEQHDEVGGTELLGSQVHWDKPAGTGDVTCGSTTRTWALRSCSLA